MKKSKDRVSTHKLIKQIEEANYVAGITGVLICYTFIVMFEDIHVYLVAGILSTLFTGNAFARQKAKDELAKRAENGHNNEYTLEYITLLLRKHPEECTNAKGYIQADYVLNTLYKYGIIESDQTHLNSPTYQLVQEIIREEFANSTTYVRKNKNVD